MAYENLPGTFQELLDGNLQIVPVNKNPVIAILGTASRGDDSFYRVESSAEATRTYGRGSGTLIRGLFEVAAGGGENMRLMRIGASPAVVAGVGALVSDPDLAHPGLRIETYQKDADASAAYSMFYAASNGRLRVKRVSDGVTVYDNSPGVPSEFVNLEEVDVSGSADLGYAIGTITCLAVGDMVSGEKVVISDGVNPAVTFWVSVDGLYDPPGGYDDTNVEWDLTGLDAAGAADELRTLIAAATLDLTTDAPGAALITITNTRWGIIGNATITETVTDVDFVVTGMVCQQTNDIGTLIAYELLSDVEDAHGAGEGPAVVEGSDGTSLSRMQMFEALHNAYALLEDQDIDYVVPMDVYLDDLSVMDMSALEVTSRNLAVIAAYPTPGATNDALGLCHVEEVNGNYHFWWHFPADPTAVSATPTANIYPTVESADATHGADGTVLEDADYHEVNFGYQMAQFLHLSSTNNETMNGFIQMKGPTSFSLRGISSWVGQLPEYIEDGNGNSVVSVNGSGLLGNKWLSGRKASGGVPGFSVDGVDGLANGGFIATDSGEIDGIQLKDDNDKLVDIGKYLSVVQAQVRLSNPAVNNPYVAGFAPAYAGLCSTLGPASAPTNKGVPNVSLPYRINKAKLDALAGLRYIALHARKRNLVVADGPTAARPDSDYTRFSTFGQVKAAIDACREVSEKFLGEGMTGILIAALETAVDKALKRLVSVGVLQNFGMQIIATPLMRARGQAIVELVLVPAFELRQLTFRVALAAAI